MSIRIAHEIFGEHTFRIREANGKWTLSQPLFDAVMVAVEKLASSERRLIFRRGRIAAALEASLKSQRVYEIVVGRPNTAKAIRQRIAIVLRVMRPFS